MGAGNKMVTRKVRPARGQAQVQPSACGAGIDPEERSVHDDVLDSLEEESIQHCPRGGDAPVTAAALRLRGECGCFGGMVAGGGGRRRHRHRGADCEIE